MSREVASAVDRAEAYYDSPDADTFYNLIWGGEDIHVGCYESPEEPIADASERTVARMAERLTLSAGSRVLDLGAGYGGAARFLARTTGCHVTCVNLSEVQNERNRQLNGEQGLSDRVDVVHGDFEKLPQADGAFDVLWSQDAFLHSGDRPRVLDEIARVSAARSELVFTDPMQADDCPDGVLQPILDRLQLQSLGSPGFYRRELAARGFEESRFEDLTHQMATHYASVARVLRERYDELSRHVSRTYMDNMLRGLSHWVEGARAGHLAWGIFHFTRGG